MRICKFADGKPTEIRDIPSAWRNVSNPTIDVLLPDGWRVYVPTQEPHVKASHWEDDGRAVREVVDATYSAEELAAQAQAKADATEAIRQAQEAERQARESAIQSLRDAYADATGQVCQLCGLTPVRVLTMAQIQDAVLAASESAKPTLALLCTLLTNIEGKLLHLDGIDALDRV